jgi:hypothetical protein
MASDALERDPVGEPSRHVAGLGLTPGSPEDDILARAAARRGGHATQAATGAADPLGFSSTRGLDVTDEPAIFRESVETIRRWLSQDRGLRRTTIVGTMHTVLEKQDWVRAAWLGGADAHRRVDRWSDIDLYVEVAEEHAESVFEVVEQALEDLAGIDRRWVVPEPTWHGGPERVYRLAEASPYLLVDTSISLLDRGRATTNMTRHGVPWVLFDRSTDASQPHAEQVEVDDLIDQRLEDLRVRVPMLHVQVDKELMRGDALAAIEMFRRFMHGPLIELLRMRHAPHRWDFGLRFTHRDLPPQVWQRLERMLYVADLDELRDAWLEARRWMLDLLTELANEHPDA